MSNAKIKEFLVAASQGDLQRVKHFVEVEKIDINATEPGGPTVTALGYAAESNQIDVVKLLLENPKIEVNKGVDDSVWSRRQNPVDNENPVDKYSGKTPLILAASQGYTDIVRLLLPRSSIYAYDCTRESALYHAVYNGHFDVVKLLLEHPQVNVNTVGGKHKRSIVKTAIRFGYQKIVCLLLDHPDIFIEDSLITQVLPMHEYMSILDIKILKRLIKTVPRFYNEYMRYDTEFDSEFERHGEIESEDENCSHDEYCSRYRFDDGDEYASRDVYGSLYENDRYDECCARQVESEKRLAIDYEGDPNWSALHAAVKYEYTEIVRVLLDDPDVDVNDQDTDDWVSPVSPLHLAVDIGNMDILRLFLENSRVDVNLPGFDGQTALYMSTSRYDQNYSYVKLLLAHPKIDVNLATKDENQTPLFAAVRWNMYKIELVKLLLNHPKIDPNISDYEGCSPLFDAVQSTFDIGLVMVLLEDPNVDPNKTNDQGWTPLYQSVSNKESDMLQLLLGDPRVELHITSNEGETALQLAIKENWANGIAMLRAGIENRTIRAELVTRHTWQNLLHMVIVDMIVKYV
eukprot:922991_1